MKLDIKTKWLEKLRSKQYSQTRGVLKDERGYCCLGVLCDIYIEENPEFRWHQTDGDYYNAIPFYRLLKGDERCGVTTLPHVVAEWAGLDTFDGEYIDQMEMKTSLAYENDRGRSFTEIALIIEEKF